MLFFADGSRQIESGKFGIVGRRGPEDKQAFMVGFFKMARGDLHVRSRRSAEGSDNSTPNEAENYYYWGADSYCKCKIK